MGLSPIAAESRRRVTSDEGSRPPRWPVEPVVAVGFGAGLMLTLLMGWISYRSITSLVDASRMVNHAEQVISRLEKLTSAVRDLESTARGYVLLGDPDMLSRYEHSLPDVPAHLAELRKETADNPSQQERLNGLQLILSEKLEYHAQIVSLRKDQGMQRAMDTMEASQGRGRFLMDAILAKVQEIRGEELRLRDARADLARERARIAIAVILVGSLIATAVVAGALARMWIAGVALRNTEAGKRRAEEEMSQFFETSLEMLCIADFQGYFRRLNPAWEKTLGWTLDELASRPFLEFVHPEDRERTQRESVNVERGEKVIHFENRYQCRDGSYRWLLWTASPLVERKMIFAVARDITDRKAREEEVRALNRQLEERSAGLLAANQELEAFTYSVSHDLRAPLRHMDGYTRILTQEYGPQLDSQAQQYLGRISKASRQMGMLIDDLLNLSRVSRQVAQAQVTGLSSLVDSVVEALQKEAGERKVDWRIGKLPFVECDPALIQQVFVNLISNALKFTRPRETALIEVGSMRQNGQSAIFVRDNGVGFSMKYADKLFGVFQRLHRPEDFEGTGVGLATVQRIVHKHSGRIWVEAELDKGACFYFTLSSPHAPAREGSTTPGGAA